MAFPQVGSESSGNQTSNSSTWTTVSYPTGVQAGDLLLLLLSSDGELSVVTATGWSITTNGRPVGAAATFCRGTRVADGTESGNFTVTLDASEQGCWRILRITAASWWGVILDGLYQPVPTNGTGLNPDPGISNPPDWDVEDTLWIACSAADHGNTTHTGFPAGFNNTTSQESGGAPGAALGVARLESAVASVDAGTFTIDASEQWQALTIAVRPAAPVVRVPRFTPYPQVLSH